MSTRTWHRWALVLGVAAVVGAVAGAAYLAARFLADRPVEHANIVDHFKYGSLGSEREFGMPYAVWKALPELFADKLPGPGYASLGFIFEDGRDLPVGVSRRRYRGFDMVWLNCAFCHTGTVRDTPESAPKVIAGMPANTFDFRAFMGFLFAASRDRRFTPDRILLQIDQMGGGGLDLLDRLILRYYGLYVMRERILTIADRLAFLEGQPGWGPGRVDTFNPLKAYFAFPPEKLSPRELIGTTDFPSIWNQRQRRERDMELHWDGNNQIVEERNKSAAMGAGVTPPTIDLPRLERIEAWLLDFRPPAWPYDVDQARAARGAAVYAQHCADCHGASGVDFDGRHVGRVTPIELIGTDRHRLDSYTPELAVNQSTVYAGYPWRFRNFRKTFGYANLPLDGLWLRAPYLHNGSVPTVRALLEPSSRRPVVFARGYDVYDRVNLGFVSDVTEEGNRRFFLFDTRAPGNSNRGHEGPAYGTELPAEDKDALVEFLKTF
jgi:hypothetical protein